PEPALGGPMRRPRGASAARAWEPCRRGAKAAARGAASAQARPARAAAVARSAPARTSPRRAASIPRRRSSCSGLGCRSRRRPSGPRTWCRWSQRKRAAGTPAPPGSGSMTTGLGTRRRGAIPAARRQPWLPTLPRWRAWRCQSPRSVAPPDMR
ncbi:unnamed protein product, partial [Prorocentrum cordatum]